MQSFENVRNLNPNGKNPIKKNDVFRNIDGVQSECRIQLCLQAESRLQVLLSEVQNVQMPLRGLQFQ